MKSDAKVKIEGDSKVMKDDAEVSIENDTKVSIGEDAKINIPFTIIPFKNTSEGLRRSLAGMEDLTTGLFVMVMSMFGLGETLKHTEQEQEGVLMV